MAWQDLLRFCHFFRHAYAVELDPVELTRTRDRLEAAVSATGPTIAAVVGALSG